MRSIALLLILCCLCAGLGCSQTDTTYWQERTQAITPIHAQSSLIDSSDSGSFWPSPNRARSVDSLPIALQEGFYLYLDTTRAVLDRKKRAVYRLYLVNNGKQTLKFFASDSHMDGGAEVYWDKQWQSIHRFPQSSCVNSYHMVYLVPKAYWVIEVPIYKGPIRMPLRYQLTPYEQAPVYSNVISMPIHPDQVVDKVGALHRLLGW